MDDKKALLDALPRIHTTEMGGARVTRNLGLSGEDPVGFCRRIISDERSEAYRKGKNYYCELGDVRITVNAGSLTIITAHRIKR